MKIKLLLIALDQACVSIGFKNQHRSETKILNKDEYTYEQVKVHKGGTDFLFQSNISWKLFWSVVVGDS